MEKWVHRILCILTMVFFLLVFLQEKTHFVEVKPLGGVVKEVGYPKFTMQSYADRSYQNDLEKYSKQKFGFREWFIRFYNQYIWDFYGTTRARVSVGRDGWLYEPQYVEEYYQSRMYDFTDEPDVIKEKFRKEAVRLYKLQEILKEFGVTLFVMIEPGKERVFPEHLPDGGKYTRPMGVKAVDYYPCLFDSLGINYVDFSKYFVEQKGKVDYPLFPQTGTHWSNIASLYATDSLIRYMEAVGNRNLNNIKVGTPYYDPTRRPDDDLEQMMNLMREMPKSPNMYADFSIIKDTSASKPKLITVGDSFFWNIINQVPLDSIFSSKQYWYYNSTIYFNPNFNSTSEIDLVAELLGTDYIMLSYCTANMYDIGNRFISKSLVQLCYDDKQVESAISHIISNMKADEKWKASLCEKAGAKGVGIEDVMREDAEYLIYTNPENHFEELGVSGVPSIRNKDMCIKRIKEQIYSYSVWLDEVKRKAELWNVSLDSAVTRDAIWCYEQSKAK